MLGSQGVQRLAKADEIAGNEACSLVQQLVEGMLTIGPLLAPYDGRSGFCHGQPLQSHMLAVAFHGQLLKVGGKALQVLIVGEHCERRRSEKVVVPDRQQAQQRRHVACERRRAKMLVHGAHAAQ